VIGRFDTYIGSTNTKAALLGTFNTFVLGTIVLKWKDLQTILNGHPKSMFWAAVFVTIAAVATLISLAFAFVAIHPFLKSYKKPGGYHSNIFFMHVSEHATGDDYRAALLQANEDAILTDLCHQAHALACGVGAKMLLLQKSVLATVVALASIAGVVVCLFIASVV